MSEHSLRWKFLCKFYIKNILKSKLYIGASILFLLMFISRIVLFFLNPFDSEDYGQLPSELSILVQVTSLFYIVFFYLKFSKEMLYGIQTFFVDGYRIMLAKISAMFVAHTVFQIVLSTVTYGSYTIVYLIKGVENTGFYVSLGRFLIIYMFAPFLLSMLFGLTVAMIWGNRKSGFFAILFIWIASGGMNTELFPHFFRDILATEWQSLLFIGMNSVMHVYESYIGFDLHLGNELKLITWFLVFSAAILILSLRWTATTRERRRVKKLVLCVVLCSLVTAYGTIKLSAKFFSSGDHIAETNFYKEMDKIKADLRYDIKSYSIELNKKQATVHIIFSRLDTLDPTFQFYHAYPLKWIKADEEMVYFERLGDIVNVSLPKNSSSLTFHYEIEDTAFVPYTNSRALLLADKAWYPKKRANQLYKINEHTRQLELTEHFLPEENYSFTLKAKEGLFCNLPRHGEIYRGNSQGISLINGQGNKIAYKDYHITYPADWPKMKERVPNVLAQLEATLHEIQLVAPTTVESLPKSIVFSRYGLSSLLTKDHLVYNTGYGDPIDSYETLKDVQEQMLQLSVPKKGPEMLFREWVYMTSRFIREKKELELEPLILRTEDKSVERIYESYLTLTTEQKQYFLKRWYEEMDDTWTWTHVMNLIKEAK